MARRGGAAAGGPAAMKHVVLWLFLTSPAIAQPSRPSPLSGVRIDQRLDQQVSLELAFRDEASLPVRLGDYFGEKPVILALVYHRCPMLCNEVLRGLCASVSALPFTAGDEFRVVVVSIDPSDTPESAAAKKASYLKHYAQAKHAGGWHFLTGNQPEITRLAEAVGFRYHYEPATRQFSHASGITVLTPRGRLARYFYGIDYPTTDLRLALVEASEHKIGSPVDQFLLLCYHYDPATGKYGWAVMGALRAAGGLTVLSLGIFIVISLARDRISSKRKGREGFEQKETKETKETYK
jgi:protein SCO1/2